MVEGRCSSVVSATTGASEKDAANKLRITPEPWPASQFLRAQVSRVSVKLNV